MSLLLGLAAAAVNAVRAARATSHAVEHETPALDELHDGLSPVRAQLMQDKAQTVATNVSADQSQGLGYPTDAADGDGGFVSDVIDWLTNIF